MPSRHRLPCVFCLAVIFLTVLHTCRILQAADPSSRHVVVIVCDGLRPDSVTQKDMPTVFQLARNGASFAHHHPVYLSSTEVNGTSLATGAYPQTSAIIANNEYRSDVELRSPRLYAIGDRGLYAHGKTKIIWSK
jgi:predicted AlkP superfamily pyrophosphatase or phosphodiesterase